jgi:hypothetical protein
MMNERLIGQGVEKAAGRPEEKETTRKTKT